LRIHLDIRRSRSPRRGRPVRDRSLARSNLVQFLLQHFTSLPQGSDDRAAEYEVLLPCDMLRDASSRNSPSLPIVTSKKS
jgi:hypothetical protein